MTDHSPTEVDKDFIRDVVLTLDGIANKLLKCADKLETSARCQVWLTERFSKLILEKGIHQALSEYESDKNRHHRFYAGWPGVPRKVVDHD